MPDVKQRPNNTGPHRWKKGECGNPKGRPPKDVSLISLAKKYLDQVPDILIGGKKNEKTWRELIVQAWLVGAYKGNSSLFVQLLERIDGKVNASVELTGAAGGPVQIKNIALDAGTMAGALKSLADAGVVIGANAAINVSTN